MLLKLFKWREDQKAFIENLPGKASEHIRRAIDDYIERKKSKTEATTSPSIKNIKNT